MDRWVRNAAMAMATTTNRRSFMSRAVRGLVGVGLGAGFLFGGGDVARANNCVLHQAIVDCLNYNCANGDNEGCSTAIYGGCTGCIGVGCPSGYSQEAYWTCCCGNSLYWCMLCKSSSGSECECQGGGGTSC